MSVWFCIPSAKPAAEAQACVHAWRAMGYKVALYRDAANISEPTIDADLVINREYEGYARAVNMLAQIVLASDARCDWIVTGGDDTIPDQTKLADVIALECTQHFAGTFGVMQPTGDRWGADPAQPNFVGSAYIDRVAGSPWLGRDWCETANNGAGPLHPDFYHMFVDEFLIESARKQRSFWQRPDLTHFHDHWARRAGNAMPGYIRPVNSPSHWRDSQAIFERHRQSRFSAGDRRSPTGPS
jgi:hypothetical protein